MAVTRTEVLRIAALARLRLEPEEVERMTGQLNGILAHIAALAEVDVAGADAVAGATEWPAARRPDEPGADPLHRPAAALAPAWQEGFFTVPRLAALDDGAA
jgi:aspartyl-tRNA(Asn)/glutamyl-tRNA(Gln) amidotransferase subunit C